MPAGVSASAPDLAGLRLITNSDAHYLDQVWEAEHAMELPERDGLPPFSIGCRVQGKFFSLQT